MPDAETVSRVSRRLRDVLEPLVGQVYFAPECHAAYEALGFGPSPAITGAVALPDGPAYFTSRGSVMGRVPGELVAAAFAVFNPGAVIPAVTMGWSITDAPTICRARTDGAVAQLERILGPKPDGLDRAAALLTRSTDTLRPEGRPLYAGVRSQGPPGSPMGDLWWTGDLLREFRGDSHTVAWVGAGLDAVEMGLLTELWLGLPMGTYIRTRAWSAEQIAAGQDRLRSRGLIDGAAFTSAGRAERTAIEEATDRQLREVVAALAEDADELIDLLAGWSRKVIDAGGYPRAGAADLARRAG
ncbi:MAG: hypothetical protein NVSMB16_07270 [Acidimicrobiales bacterium]